jgi:hypothetical protein
MNKATDDTPTIYGDRQNTDDQDEVTRDIVGSINDPDALAKAMIEKTKQNQQQKQQEHLNDILRPPPNYSTTKTGKMAYDLKEEIEQPKRQIEHDKQKKIYDDFNKTGGKYSKRKYSRIKRKRVTRKGMRKTRAKSKKNNRKHYKRH